MLKALQRSAFACGLFLAAAPAFAQFGGTCTRADLQAATEAYLKAQTVGDAIQIPLSGWTQYNENLEMATMSTGILSKPLKIDFSRSILDPTSCQTFTEVVVADPAKPYVIGTIMAVRDQHVGQIDSVITHPGDWLFNAANTLKYSKAENWGEIPAAERDSRATLQAAADAYLNRFNDPKVQVPWGSPCERLEGGAYTGKGEPGQSPATDTCDVGVPTGVKIVDRHYVIDEALGAVAVLSSFGNNALPDFHTFRIEHGKIRYVHTITVCKSPNCGLKPPAGAPKAS